MVVGVEQFGPLLVEILAVVEAAAFGAVGGGGFEGVEAVEAEVGVGAEAAIHAVESEGGSESPFRLT